MTSGVSAYFRFHLAVWTLLLVVHVYFLKDKSSVVYVCARLCPTLCDPMDCGPPGNSPHGILQARILQRVAISYSRGSFRPRDQICVSCISRWIPYYGATWEAQKFCYLFAIGKWSLKKVCVVYYPLLLSTQSFSWSDWQGLFTQHVPAAGLGTRNLPGGPVAKTLHSQCRGQGFDHWSGNQVSHAAAKCSNAATKDLACCNEAPKLRPGAAKEVNK